MKRAVFFDRDGTINEEVGYIKNLAHLKLIKGSVDSIKKLRKASNFAKDKGIFRTSTYKLIEEGVIDYITIDNVVFVVLNDKAISYKKRFQE